MCAIISEEQENMIDTGNHNGKYIVAIDPLDGSSNIDVTVVSSTTTGIASARPITCSRLR